MPQSVYVTLYVIGIPRNQWCNSNSNSNSNNNNNNNSNKPFNSCPKDDKRVSEGILSQNLRASIFSVQKPQIFFRPLPPLAFDRILCQSKTLLRMPRWALWVSLRQEWIYKSLTLTELNPEVSWWQVYSTPFKYVNVVRPKIPTKKNILCFFWLKQLTHHAGKKSHDIWKRIWGLRAVSKSTDWWFKVEVTNNLWNGHLIIIQERSQLESPGVEIMKKLHTWITVFQASQHTGRVAF